MIKVIPYERIDQKNQIELELFSKLTPEEVRSTEETWRRIQARIRLSNWNRVRATKKQLV